MYRTIQEIKAANKAAEQHFFDEDTMRFFRSRVESGVIGGRYFITSEQFVGSDEIAQPRRYTIRVARENGHVDTVGEFQEYGTKGLAVRAAHALTDLTED